MSERSGEWLMIPIILMGFLISLTLLFGVSDSDEPIEQVAQEESATKQAAQGMTEEVPKQAKEESAEKKEKADEAIKEESKQTKAQEEEGKSGSEEGDTGDPVVNPMSLLLEMLKRVVFPLFGITLLGVFVTLGATLLRKVMEIESSKEDDTSKYDTVKIKKKSTGGESATHVVKILKVIERLTESRYTGVSRMEELEELGQKLEEILTVYMADTDEFGLDMYKYEKTFVEMYVTIQKAEEIGLLQDKGTLSTLLGSVGYPYEEIVQQHARKWANGDLEKENEILEDLKKKYQEGDGE